MRSCQTYGDIRIRKYYAEKCSESTSLQIQPQHWGDQLKLRM